MLLEEKKERLTGWEGLEFLISDKCEKFSFQNLTRLPPEQVGDRINLIKLGASPLPPE